MYLFSHLYVSQKIINRFDKQILLGSILPDYAVTKLFKFGSTHYADFYDFIISNYPEYKKVALGVMLHSNELGLDRYAHKYYKGGPGWCFLKSEPIIKDITESFNVLGEEAKKIGHMFIEAATTFLIVKEKPEVIDLLEKTIESTTDISSEILSNYFSIDREEMKKAINSANNNIFAPNKLKQFNDFVDFQVEGVEVIYNIVLDKSKVEGLLTKAIDLIREDYLSFLDYCSDEIKKEVTEKYPDMATLL